MYPCESSAVPITFSPKITLKNRHFHHDKRCILENECSVAPLGCSTSPKTPLLPYEVAPTSRTFADGNHIFPKKTPSKNRQFHHDKRYTLENECSVAPLGWSTSPKTPLLPYEVAPTSRTFADGNHTFLKKKHPQKIGISPMINGVFWKMNAQWHH